MSSYDVIVVGSRCAGASLAMLLARWGHRVLVLDRARFPSDTLSTHFLPPRATSLLESWGLLTPLMETGCPLIKTITLDVGPVAIRGHPDPHGGTDAMVCPRRRVLDHLLVTSVRDAGAEIREATTVKELLWQGDRVCGVRAAGADGREVKANAQLVIGADGLWSRVARETNAACYLAKESLSCVYYSYWANVPCDGVEFYRRAQRVILVFPTHDNLTCIYVGLPYNETSTFRANIEATYHATLESAPNLVDRVRAGQQVEPFKGTNKLPNFYRQSWGNGWALVGDAAYHRDPITGMGIGDAFLGAQLLGDAINQLLAGSKSAEVALSEYQAAFREQTQDVYDYTLRSAALLDPSPLMDFYNGISRSPQATRQLMNVMTGQKPHRTLFNALSIAQITAHTTSTA